MTCYGHKIPFFTNFGEGNPHKCRSMNELRVAEIAEIRGRNRLREKLEAIHESVHYKRTIKSLWGDVLGCKCKGEVGGNHK